jgi:isopenicillin N synthase-like dioxygenase
VAECFHRFGILLIRDPRVDMSDNEEYIDLMEDYFERTGELFYTGEKVADIKPETFYQVGATPEFIEKARDHAEKLAQLALPAEDTPVSPLEPVLDAKWRFMWKIGERFEGDQADFPQVIPQGFPDWEVKMNKWGNKLLQSLNTCSEMAAIGMGVHKDTFKTKMRGGAHLLAPTGSDLEKFNKDGTVFAGFHYDISFMTIHGKSRYPGLSVWTRNWKKKAVKIPEGCLIVQAGLSFEHITGGYVLAGFHEVVFNEQTRLAYERRQQQLQRDGIIKK